MSPEFAQEHVNYLEMERELKGSRAGAAGNDIATV